MKLFKNDKKDDDKIDLTPTERALIENKIKAEVDKLKKKKEIEELKARLAEAQGKKPKVNQAPKVVPKPIEKPPQNGKAELRQDDKGLYYFTDIPNVFFDSVQIVQELARRQGGPHNGKAHDQKTPPKVETIKPKAPKIGLKLSLPMGKPKAEKTTFNAVSSETVNLHASNILPKSEKLMFVDPKAVELDAKATPAMRHVIEQMSRPVQAKKSIDPKVMIGIGIAFAIAMIGLVIFYNQVIEPANAKQRAYELEVMRNGGNMTGITPPSGGGLFKFEPPNPFVPCPTCPGGSQYKG